MDNKHISLKSFLNKLEGFSSVSPYPQRGKACITYNSEKSKILDWGINASFRAKEEDIYINNFMDKLYYIFKKGKLNWDENDVFLMQAISDFIRLKLSGSAEYLDITCKNPDAFHYVFIVPSEWHYKIREELIRTIFVQSKIISKDDHRDRLLFFTDLESTYCFLQDRTYANIKGTTQIFKKGEQSILCRAGFRRNGTLSVKLDLIEPQQSLVDVVNATLFPKVLRSSTISITTNCFRRKVWIFLRDRIFQDITEAYQDSILDRITDHILLEFSKPKYTRHDKTTNYSEKTLFSNAHIKEWDLSKSQIKTLKQISVSDICFEIDEHILSAVKQLLQYNFGKRRTLLVVHECYSSTTQLVSPLVPWLNCFLKMNERASSYKLELVSSSFENSMNMFISKLMTGAANKAAEVIRDSNIHALPYILPKDISKIDHDSPSSVFLDSKPNVIINIDISYKSTFISYLLLNNSGNIEKVFYHNYLTGNMRLPALNNFFEVSDITTLKVKNQVISFMEKCLNKDLHSFSKYDRKIEKVHEPKEKTRSKRHIQKFGNSKQFSDFFVKRKERLMPEIEAIFNDKFLLEEASARVQQPKYIKVFLMMYLAYLNRLIFSRLPKKLNSSNKDLNMGYIISVEKKLLNEVIGTKENLKELVFSSEMVENNDESTKLKVYTQGKWLLPLVQQTLKLKLPLKSYFMLAQLREDYIQLTLNQVVIASSLEKEVSSVIIQDEIISILNIYESLCINIWNYLWQHKDLVQLCAIHNNDGYEDLFTLQSKKYFFKAFQKYISNNITSVNTYLYMDDRIMIGLSCHCTCGVHLSVRDIVEISFTPTLQKIITTMSSSLVNNSLFGNYIDMQYLFISVRFNHNPQFQKILVNILTRELDYSIEDKKIETQYFILPELQPTQSANEHWLISQESFRVGTLNQVSRESYGFTITQFKKGYKKIAPLYREKRTDKVAIEVKENHIFPFFMKGDIISSCGIDKTFYLEKQSKLNRKPLRTGKSNRERICISLYKLKNLNHLKPGSKLPFEANSWDKIKDFLQELELSGYENERDIPIMISMRSKCYSSSLEFSLKIVGETAISNENNRVHVGEPMTLARF